MKSIKLKYICFVLLIAFSGCRKDEKNEKIVTNTPTGDPTIEVVSGVTGFVTNVQGMPIANAAVTIYNKQAKTDENGIFYVNNVGLKRTSSAVHVKKDGYFEGYKSFIPDLGKKSFVQLQLIERGDPAVIQSDAGGSITINGGANLSIPANSIIIKDGGAEYNGEVQVYTHWYDPTDPDLGLSMPGNLTGILPDESEVQLGTYGMMAVELETANGVSLQLAEDSKATLIFPVSSELNPPESIPLWSFDESDAVWEQEGEAKLNDFGYIAEVSHFSFWNCDVPFPLINFEGKITYQGTPVSNFPVTISVDNLISATGSTDNEGVIRGKVPKGENLLLTMRNCGVTVVSLELGVLEEDINIGTIDVDLQNFITVIKGNVVGCLGDPLENSYGLLKSNGVVRQVITPLADGSFLTSIAGCEGDNYTFQFIDPEDLKGSEIYDVSSDLTVHDFGEIRICDFLEEYISYSIDGQLTPLRTVADVYYSNNEKLIIRAEEANVLGVFELDVFAEVPGDYNPSSMYIDEAQPFDPQKGLSCGDHFSDIYSCDEFNITITEFDEYVSGTFSGLLGAYPDSLGINPNLPMDEFAIEGSFRLKIDDFITTGEISGQFWFDDNGNNTREDNEDRIVRNSSATLISKSGNEIWLFPTGVRGKDGKYKFTNVLPGTYEIWKSSYEGLEHVEKDVGGDDDRDSDFSAPMNGRFISNEIIITSNEVHDNVDLGYKLPQSVTCGGLFSFGCAPNLKAFTQITGGIPPYQVSINGEQVMTVFGNPVFEVGFGGDYIIEVIDDIENVCYSEGFIQDYNNWVSGYIWEDKEGGDPNILDSEDVGMSDVLVILSNEAGDIFSEIVVENGYYQFNSVPPGSYYIVVEAPDSFEFVEQNVIINNGSDVDSIAGRSDIIIVEDCNSYTSIDAGLRAN